MLKFICLIGIMVVLAGCPSIQVVSQVDCGSVQGKSMSATHKDTDQNKTDLAAPIAVGVGGSTPSNTGTTAGK